MHPSSRPLSRVIAAAAAALALACAPKVLFQPSETFHAPGFDGSAFSQRAILITPVYSGKGFDTTSAISPQRQGAAIRQAYPDIAFADKLESDRAVTARYDSSALSAFYENLGKGNAMALQTSDSVWQALKADLLLTARIREAVKIRSFARETKRRLSLEAELWQVDNIRLLWRGEVAVSTFDTTTTDADLVWGALLHVFGTLPSYRPGMNEKNW